VQAEVRVKWQKEWSAGSAGVPPAMLQESMSQLFFIHAGETPALPGRFAVTTSHRFFNPALLAAQLAPGYWLPAPAGAQSEPEFRDRN
jgi:hypothetical protein